MNSTDICVHVEQINTFITNEDFTVCERQQQMKKISLEYLALARLDICELQCYFEHLSRLLLT